MSRYRFGPFDLDTDNQELRKHAIRIRIQKQPFQVLRTLVERAGTIVSRDELRQAIWANDTFVDFEHGLNSAVNKVRQALGDSSERAVYVETIPGRGYRFVAAAQTKTEEQAPSAVKRAKILVPALVGIVALTVAAGFFYFRPGLNLTEKDMVVLADFTNSTSDPVFDGALRQGLAVQLEQSPFLKVMDDSQVRQSLGLMSLPPAQHITNQIAHDVCVRTGAAATIDGSIVSLGKAFVITLQAVNCHSNVTIAREQVQANDKEHALNALGNASAALRARLGESRNSIEKRNRPLDQATTASLEALQDLSASHTEMAQGRFLTAIPLLEQAIKLDPDFAMAYHFLAIAADNLGESDRSCDYSKKAFNLIGRTSDFEHARIIGDYFQACTGEYDKAIDTYRSAAENYPRQFSFHTALSDAYLRLGKFEEALDQAQQAARLEPSSENPYRREMDAYVRLNRFDEARQAPAQAVARGLDGPGLHLRQLEVALITGNQHAAENEIRWFAGRSEEYFSLALQAKNADGRGDRSAATDLYHRASSIALRENLAGAAAEFAESDALAYALRGNCSPAHRLGGPLLALAICGEIAKTEKLAVDYSRRFPHATLWNRVQSPAIRAAMSLARNRPSDAIESLRPAEPFERAYPEVTYLRGRAFLRLNRPSEAQGEFQKILNQPGANWGLYSWLAAAARSDADRP